MCIDFDKKWIGLDFSQTHPVTLVGGPALNVFTKAANGCVPGLPDGLFSNQKIPIWVNFGGSCNGKSWHIL
jgi:hypothetical protein